MSIGDVLQVCMPFSQHMLRTMHGRKKQKRNVAWVSSQPCGTLKDVKSKVKYMKQSFKI